MYSGTCKTEKSCYRKNVYYVLFPVLSIWFSWIFFVFYQYLDPYPNPKYFFRIRILIRPKSSGSFGFGSTILLGNTYNDFLLITGTGTLLLVRYTRLRYLCVPVPVLRYVSVIDIFSLCMSPWYVFNLHILNYFFLGLSSPTLSMTSSSPMLGTRCSARSIRVSHP
jgi:hypothetical protein